MSGPLVPEASVILFCCSGVSGVSGQDCGSGVTGLGMRASSGAARISPSSKVLGSRSSTSNSCSGSGRSMVTYFSFSRIVRYVRCRFRDAIECQDPDFLALSGARHAT